MTIDIDGLISAARAIEAKRASQKNNHEVLNRLTNKAKQEGVFTSEDLSNLSAINLDMSKGLESELDDLISSLNFMPAK